MQSYTVKLAPYEQAKNNNGRFPIYIRVTISRKISYISTGHYIPLSAWDEKNERVRQSHPMADIINIDIADRKQSIVKHIVKNQLESIELTASQVTAFFKGKDLSNIFEFTEQARLEFKGKVTDSTLENWRKHIQKLKLYHGSGNLSFKDITPEYLSAYEMSLRKEVSNNYAWVLIKTIKRMFKLAAKKKITKDYPFDEFEAPVYKQGTKDYLSFDEVLKFDALADETKNKHTKETCTYFLLGCFTGLRVSDWLKFNVKEHIKGNKILLRAKKNNEWVSIPLHSLSRKAVDRIRLTPLTIYEQDINDELKSIAKALKIKKKLTTHSGRHTFAVTMCAERGISLETCAELMGITIDTCSKNYYRVNDKKIESETSQAWKDLFFLLFQI